MTIKKLADGSNLVVGTTINGEPLRMAFTAHGEDVYYYGDGWCLRRNPLAEGDLLDYFEARAEAAYLAAKGLRQVANR